MSEQTSVRAQLVINEIMPAPKAPEPEWVELLNIGTQDFNIENLYLHDSGSRAAIPSCSIPAGTYVVLCKDTAALRASRVLPLAAILLKMSLPSLNNTAEPLTLVRKDSVVLDSVYYDTKWGMSSRSLERRDPAKPALSADNLSACTLSSGATCGSLNSVSPLERDVALNAIRVDSIARTLSVIAKNNGNSVIERSTLQITFGRAQPLTMDLGSMQADSIAVLTWSLDYLRETLHLIGQIQCTAIVSSEGDLRPTNDSLNFELYLSPIAHSLSINEILYDPSDGKSEFVELYNATSDELDLYLLHLKDASGAVLTVHQNVLVAAGGYAVIAHDSSILNVFPRLRDQATLYIESSSFSLNSTGDIVQLCDPYGYVIDSVAYESTWHSPAVSQTKGRSLEKRAVSLISSQPSSWTTCTDSSGCTPGRTNSVARSISVVRDVQADPNPFSPRSNAGDKQSTVVSYTIPFTQARVRASVYDVNGSRVRVIANDQYSGSSGVVVWDGLNDQGYALMCGVYVLLLEAVDVNTNDVIRDKMLLVIGE